MSFVVRSGSAKTSFWETLIQDLDRDPWGRPYKIVMNKLRPWVPPIAETVEPDFLDRVIMTLFPEGGEPYAKPPFPRWSEEEHGVFCVEVGRPS